MPQDTEKHTQNIVSGGEIRVGIDVGGTFTDVVIADERGDLAIGKALTTPDRVFAGMQEAIAAAADERGLGLAEVLAATDVVIYGTTRATNAIVERRTAKTALLLTEGFPNILVLREGGKEDGFDFTQDYPDPYIPQHHTFEVPERVDAEGGVVRPIDRGAARAIVERIRARAFEAVAVCLLWSIVNPDHELALAELLDEIVPGVPYTLSHRLLPVLREYRRASATAIDASLKPLMREHLREMEDDLRAAGYRGEVLVSTAIGGCMAVRELADRPIHSVRSGPSMAPVAGRAYAAAEAMGGDVIVCDTGGTTFDVSLVRESEVKHTRETWIGGRWRGDILGISAVDVRSIGAGGGSIAWIDPGGLLQVGPQSAGAEPGPACYGKGGVEPTVTDAAAVLGYIDPEYFLGGRMALDVGAARAAMARVAEPLAIPVEDAAWAVNNLAGELMIKAIQEITVAEGFDPRESVLVAGGGAAGLNIMPIARELECARLILPHSASVLSACGMQFAEIVFEHAASRVTTSDRFDFDGVNAALTAIDDELDRFARALGDEAAARATKSFFVEGRYRFQIWELEIPLPPGRFEGAADVARLLETFHRTHERIHAVRDPEAELECLNWKGRIAIALDAAPAADAPVPAAGAAPAARRREAFFGRATVATPVHAGRDLPPGTAIAGPAIIEEPTTTLVVYPGMSARRSGAGNYLLDAVAT